MPARARSPAPLPVLSPLAELFPGGGLRPGATVAVPGSTSLLLALLAGVSASGGWCAVVGLPQLGATAAAELGVVLERLASVPTPGQRWTTVVAALLDAVPVVAVRPPGRPRAEEVSRLAARTRERRAALLVAGDWAGADLRLTVTVARWEGLDAGAGHLAARQVTVRAEGRGAAARPRTLRLWLPAYGGGVALAAEPAVALPAEPAALTAEPGAVAAAPAVALPAESAIEDELATTMLDRAG